MHTMSGSVVNLREDNIEECDKVVNSMCTLERSAQTIKTNIASYLAKLSAAATAYDKLLVSLLDYLDPSWEYTQQLESATSKIQSTMITAIGQLYYTLPEAMESHVTEYKIVEPKVKKWKEYSSQLDRKLKAFESSKFHEKSSKKSEKIRMSAELKANQCQKESASIIDVLNRLNIDGVEACCKTWSVLINFHLKTQRELSPLWNDIEAEVRRLRLHSTARELPDRRGFRRRRQFIRSATLSQLSTPIYGSTDSLSAAGSLFEDSPRRSQKFETLTSLQDSQATLRGEEEGQYGKRRGNHRPRLSIDTYSPAAIIDEKLRSSRAQVVPTTGHVASRTDVSTRPNHHPSSMVLTNSPEENYYKPTNSHHSGPRIISIPPNIIYDDDEEVTRVPANSVDVVLLRAQNAICRVTETHC